jgi:amino acid transporter
MTQSKFSLADLISLLTGIGFGFICFLGFNFYSFGDTRLSIFVASVITLLMIGTSMIAIRLKRTNRNFKIRRIWEILFLFLFTAFTVCFTYFPFSHYFSVTNNEVEIQSKLSKNLGQVDKLYEDYQKYYEIQKVNQEGGLDSAILNFELDHDTSQFLEFGLIQKTQDDDLSYDAQKRSFIEKFKRDLFPRDFNEKRKKDSIYVENSRNIIYNWKYKPIGIFEIIKNLENVIASTKEQLINLSKNGDHKIDSFAPVTSVGELKTLFETIDKPTITSLVLGFVVWVLMLLSYFTSKRSNKNRRKKTSTGEFSITIDSKL